MKILLLNISLCKIASSPKKINGDGSILLDVGTVSQAVRSGNGPYKNRTVPYFLEFPNFLEPAQIFKKKLDSGVDSLYIVYI